MSGASCCWDEEEEEEEVEEEEGDKGGMQNLFVGMVAAEVEGEGREKEATRDASKRSQRRRDVLPRYRPSSQERETQNLGPVKEEDIREVCVGRMDKEGCGG